MRQNVVEKNHRSHGKVRAPQSGAGQPWLHSAVSSRPCQSAVEVGPEKLGAASDQRWVGKYPYYPNLPPILPWNHKGCGHAESGDHPKCQGRDAGSAFQPPLLGRTKHSFASATNHGHSARARSRPRLQHGARRLNDAGNVPLRHNIQRLQGPLPAPSRPSAAREEPGRWLLSRAQYEVNPWLIWLGRKPRGRKIPQAPGTEPRRSYKAG
jgi:hypothetical protein